MARGKDYDFNNLTQLQKNQIAAALHGTEASKVDRVVADFYGNLFAVMVEDTIAGLRRVRLSPVPYRQCAVCGSEEEKLYYPRGILPDGYGYCSWACYQLKPPPILVVEKTLEIDFLDLIRALGAETTQGRSKMVRQLVDWVLGPIALH